MSAITTVSSDAVELINTAMLTPEGRDNPYPHLQALHAHGHMTLMPEGWVAVYGYEAAAEVMRSPSFGRFNPARRTRVAWPRPLSPSQEAELVSRDADLGLWLQLIDAPEHTRQRRLVGRAFTPSHMVAFGDSIRRWSARLLNAVPRGEVFDFLDTVAYPLPREVIGELVGLEIADRDVFARLARTQLAERDPMTTYEELLAAADARVEIARIIRGVVAQRRSTLGSDFASELIKVEEDGERLTESELIALISMIYIGGYGTTAHAITNGVHMLARHPRVFDELKADSSLVGRAIDEMLRYDTNVVTIDYYCKQDTEIAGEPIRGGTPVQVMLGAANHDPAAFPDPATLDIHRDGPAPLSFGLGPHVCLGKPLAKLELTIALEDILGRFEGITLHDEGTTRFDSFTYREFSRFPVTFS